MATETSGAKAQRADTGGKRFRVLGAGAVLIAAVLLAKVHIAGIDNRYPPIEPPGVIVNVNTDDAATLSTLESIGPERARRIVEFRTKNGPFRSFPDLEKVDGIGRETTKALLGRIRFDT